MSILFLTFYFLGTKVYEMIKKINVVKNGNISRFDVKV